MKVIEARNVNHAILQGIKDIQEEGIERDSRNGPVLEFPTPVCTVYRRPFEKVMTSPTRDCNPFFHLMESIWMIAGRNDVEFVARYSPGMRKYSTDGEVLSGAYGHRILNHFKKDQFRVVIERLKKFPDDRRCVIQLWDSKKDLRVDNDELDRPCNTSMFFLIRDGKLDLTVTNRSNDMIFGAYGANAVHFAFFQEYVAAAVGVGVGNYYQISNNLHVYTDSTIWNKVRDINTIDDLYSSGRVVGSRQLVTNARSFLKECQEVCDGSDGPFKNTFLNEVVVPVREVHRLYKDDDLAGALAHCQNIFALDWRIACSEWIDRRIERRKSKF